MGITSPAYHYYSEIVISRNGVKPQTQLTFIKALPFLFSQLEPQTWSRNWDDEFPEDEIDNLPEEHPPTILVLQTMFRNC